MSDDTDTSTSTSSSGRSISAPVRAIVELMDNRFEIAGHRFGFDALIGLLPGIGDALGGLVGVVVVLEALRLKAPWTLVGRMLLNLWIDSTLGSVPLVGDAFDFYFKAHRRNLELLQRYAAG